MQKKHKETFVHVCAFGFFWGGALDAKIEVTTLQVTSTYSSTKFLSLIVIRNINLIS